MKKFITITSAILILMCFSTGSAYADKKTMEGFMLGTGVAILTAVIYNELYNDSEPRYTHYYSGYNGYRHTGYRHGHKKKHHRKKYRPPTHRGHWEVDKIWMDPVYEKKWNPGHYNRRGNWVSGRYEKFLISNGYWQKEKVWVRY